MKRFLVTNERATVGIEVWAFDESHAIEIVERLTDSKEYTRVQYVSDAKLNDIVSLDATVLDWNG